MNAVKRTVCLFLSCALLASTLLLGGCQRQAEELELTAEQTENLVKLCKVWGYVKYTHPAFLLGKLDWDEELLKLIPQVQAAETAEETNTLLHEWFQSLGEIDYGRAPGSIKLHASKQVVVADISWTADAAYLGEDLAEDLAQLPETLPSIDRTNAPVRLSAEGLRDFSNEKDHDPAYDDTGFRLLGLFRLWNAMEYFYPYFPLPDQDWETCLTECIPAMLEGTDQESYRWVLANLAYRLQDTHVVLWTVSDSNFRTAALSKFSTEAYLFPAPLTEAEGQLVVAEGVEGYPFAAGDVLVSINGRSISELAEECKPYICYTREEVFLMRACDLITASETEDIEVVILRGEEELTFSVQAADMPVSDEELPLYEILDGGIGLINPGEIKTVSGAQETVEALRDTQALIIDLRQYPGGNEFADLYRWILGEDVPIYTFAKTWFASPGVYQIEEPVTSSYFVQSAADYDPYDKPVVVLMDQTSMSYGETSIMALGEGENVVLMGGNSIGSNGTVAYLPLPGMLSLSFSSCIMCTVDGECTQRTGITPDIRVEPTIQGISEGRDELMEAAVAYLQDHT